MKAQLIPLIALLLPFIACRGDGSRPDHAATPPPAEITADQVTQGLATITAEGILRGVEFLSSDELEGRGTDTEGERKAAEWIAKQYEEIGLEPLGESYFQEVELMGYRKKEEVSTLTITGPDGAFPYEVTTDLTYWSNSLKPTVDLEKAPVVFVGYGVEAPEVGWDDFKGYDPAGKVLIFLNNDPPVEEDGKALFGGETRTYYGRWTYKFEQAMRHGAAGAIVIHTTPSAGYGWEVINTAGDGENFDLNLPGTGYLVDFLAFIHEDVGDRLAQTVGSTLEGWFEQAKSRDFAPVELPVTLDAHIETELRKTSSNNVVGVLHGSDPELRDELIVFSAHYDHIGMGRGEGDRIYNGAWDNAAGTSAIIELARGLKASEIQPARSVAFLACAAEEKGSLGSRWFVDRPPVPLKNIVANLNIDMPQIFGLTKDMAAIGKTTNSLGDTLTRVASVFGVEGGNGARLPIEITDDPNPNAGSFYRSDQVNFAKVGIPALFLNPGRDYINEIAVDPSAYRKEHYHKKSDEINDAWDLSGCARDMQVLMLVALNVANDPEIPRWTPGNEFEEEWRRLHNGS